MKNEHCASNLGAFSNSEIITKYFQAVKEAAKWCDYSAMREFKRQFPDYFKHFSAVHRKRVAIHQCINAMSEVGAQLKWGTLTFKNSKDKNKVECKRKEAFKLLNTVFKYILLVEEYGGEHGRYHIHFIASFKYDHDFNDFVKFWHSRQELRDLKADDDIAKYLCKYFTKDLPRVRKTRIL